MQLDQLVKRQRMFRRCLRVRAKRHRQIQEPRRTPRRNAIHAFLLKKDSMVPSNI
jgi:hypothetical protein